MLKNFKAVHEVQGHKTVAATIKTTVELDVESVPALIGNKYRFWICCPGLSESRIAA